MSRSQRLLELMQILRRYRTPVRGQKLADDLGISLRSLYRDIATLQQQGAVIQGEAGVGYVLKAGFTLPPLMLTSEEIEALVLGARWVARRADAGLAKAAEDLVSKVAAVLPSELRFELDSTALLVAPSSNLVADSRLITTLRLAIRNERKVNLTYLDLKNSQSQRVLWPFALGFFDNAQVMVAWCELRQAFRSFRVDRMQKIEITSERYPRRRQALFKGWKAIQSMKGDNAADRN